MILGPCKRNLLFNQPNNTYGELQTRDLAIVVRISDGILVFLRNKF
jgi:hypothetical protein